ncbi:MAG: tetratricopeptide repeat protein [Planctomycetota bacterium]|nr:tetratricopeptide repeat protein [Planctomycetota bacterium]
MNASRAADIQAYAKKARSTGLFASIGPAREGLGIADLGVLKIAGPDAAKFLHGQITNEVNALMPGEGNLNARVTRTGTLTRIFSLHRLPQETPAFLILLDRDGVEGLRADLDGFLFDDAAMDDASAAFDWLLLQGPQAPALAEEVFGPLQGEPWVSLREHAVRALEHGGIPPGTWAIARSLTGDAGYLIAVPREADMLDPIAERLGEAARAKDFVSPKGGELGAVLEILRIEAGVVRRGIDYRDDQRVLPETGLEQQLVSYTKGCYLGQEVIARIRTYGSTPSALRGLVFDGANDPAALLADLPDAGASLLIESGQKVGEIVSRTDSPVMEAPVAFAYLGRQQRTPGTKLRVKGASGIWNARVALLPFYHAPDRQSRARFLHDKAIRVFANHRDQEAIDLLLESLRLDPSFADAYEALGVILGRTSRFEEAVDIFKRLEEVAPHEPMVHTNLSLFYMKMGNKEKAELEKAKATTKAFGQVANEAEAAERAEAEAAARRADAERKKGMFTEVLEIDSEDPVALFGLGNALLQLNETEAAAKTYAKACEVQKDNSAVYLALGKALEALKRDAEALDVYRKGMDVASKKGDLMPLKEMEHRALLLESSVR